MISLSRIALPLAVAGGVCAAAFGGFSPVDADYSYADAPIYMLSEPMEPGDTVVYPIGGYKLRRVGNFEEVKVADSLIQDIPDSLLFTYGPEEDTLPKLTARDTIPVPDSLREIDPFRFKYYVALLDSATHIIVRDSLQHESDSLMGVFMAFFNEPVDSITPTQEDTLHAYSDSLLSAADLYDRLKLDSLYVADSIAAAKAAFEAWYNSLSKEERKKYDFEQKELAKKHKDDSIRVAKEEKQAIKDSIVKNTPRILDAYAIPADMQTQRIIAWTEDRDFQDLNTYIPDTTYNHYFHDYVWHRKDVNASWLGVAGSPLQYYNFFNRTSETGVTFYEPYAAWSFSPQTLIQYNSKTPYTEFAYWGTLFANQDKESDNVHILTTQNITPGLNFSILYDRWGGGGMLINEAVKNKTFAAGLNYVGKKYTANGGFISNDIECGENGGIYDKNLPDEGVFWIRDTTLEDVREIRVRNNSATSTTKKKTFYADNQFRIPFNFINDIKMKRDSTFVPDSTADITTAFVGHGIEYSTFTRQYKDGDIDSLRQNRLDNKIYIRLQPWSSDAFISKIDVGVGDYLQRFDEITSTGVGVHKENSLYTYAGANGFIGDGFSWNAKMHYVFAGSDFGNMDLGGNVEYKFYPWRRARKSPVTISANISESLLRPSYYQRHMYSITNEDLRWDAAFDRTSTTKVGGRISIPYWKMDASVNYALLANNIYYDTLGIAKQNAAAMSVLSASLRKEFVIGDMLHLDNRLLFQHSSNKNVMDLPAVAANLRYFIDFSVQKDASGQKDVMRMQIGADIYCNTPWYAPAWSPETGTFHNQDSWRYTNGPFFDVFVNVQWKRACIFIKLQNLGEGWPMDHADYFSAHHYIVTQGSSTGLKVGVWWPFYTQPYQNKKALK